MKDLELEEIPLEDLWGLHGRITAILDRKLRDEKRKLEVKLDELGRQVSSPPAEVQKRRPYPKVEPKFRNPADPSMTWSGRGKQPHWVGELLATGKRLDDLRI
jgi:DNA-binding protein H-NS